MSDEMRRREFLKWAGGTAFWALPIPPPRSTAPNPHPVLENRNAPSIDPASPKALQIVDTHQHLWDLDRFQLPWLETSSPLHRSFTMPDYLAEIRHVNVVRSVYVEVGVAPEQRDAEAQYVIELCARGDSPLAAAVIGGDPAAHDFKDYISRYRGSAYVRGVRSTFRGPAREGGPPDPEFTRGVRLLGDLGLSFDLLVNPTQLRDASRLVAACPHTQFIVDHCGNPDVQSDDRSEWERGLLDLAGHKNISCKISGIIASASPDKWQADDMKPIVDYVIQAFGTDRVMFGGDWPVCTKVASLQVWAQALAYLARIYRPEYQRKLFHDNAMKIYRLS